MRYDYEATGSHIEYSDSWTRSEVARLFNLSNEEYLAHVRSKIMSVHLHAPGGEHITSPDMLNETALDRVDWPTYLWFVETPTAHVREMQRLGEAARRALYDGSERPNE